MRPLGIYLWFGYDLAPQKSLELIRAAGFDSVSLWWGEYSGAPAPGVQARWAGENGLSLDSAHFPDKGADTLWQPGSAGDRLAQTVRQALFQCGEAGVPVLVMHLTEGFRQPPFTQWGMERLRRLADAAAEAKVRLALENLPCPYHLAEALEALPGPEVGLCWDTGHAYFGRKMAERGERKPFPAFPGRFASRIAAVHLHDNDGTWDQHRLPFEGGIDWDAAMRELACSGYEGGLHLEVQGAFGGFREDGEAAARVFLKRAHTVARRLRGRLERYRQEEGNSVKE